MLAPSAHTWRLIAAAPPREVFAVVEQMIGTPPYRYEIVGESEARDQLRMLQALGEDELAIEEVRGYTFAGDGGERR